ncbi:MAG: hypothetical protein ACK4LA_01085, partial [Aquificaceae bacterium]
RVILLWRQDKREEMKRVLIKTGYGKDEVFYMVAQAISEALSPDDEENKLLAGFLMGKERLKGDIGNSGELF